MTSTDYRTDVLMGVLSDKVRARRLSLNMTTRRCSMEIGCTETVLCSFEDTGLRLSVHQMLKVLDWLKIKPADFFTEMEGIY